MNKLIIACWISTFVAGYLLYAFFIWRIKNNDKRLYEEWGCPKCFTATTKQSQKIQSYIFKHAFSNTRLGFGRVDLLRSIAIMEVIYALFFIKVAMDVLTP